MQIMQFLLIKHGVLPGAYYPLSEGEKTMIRALFCDYIDAMNTDRM